ncbi:MAG: hypothetical protein P8Z36_07405 [Gemmatimonadota bacterium]
MNATPTVPAVPHEVPVNNETRELMTQLVTRKNRADMRSSP